MDSSCFSDQVDQSQVTEREPHAADDRHGFWTTCLAYSLAANLGTQGVLAQPRASMVVCRRHGTKRLIITKHNNIFLIGMKEKSAQKAYVLL